MAHMFFGCSSLENLNLTNFDMANVTNTDGMCEYDSKLEELLLPNNLKVFGEYFCERCSVLETLTIPNDLISIGNFALSFTSLSSLTIPDAVTSIGTYAFSGISHIYYHGSATGSPWGASAIN